MTNKVYAAHLLDEPPILVYPTLAEAIGINHAIIFQQLHFLLNGQKTAKNTYNFVADANGVKRWWVYNSYPEWKRDYFPWLSISALKSIFRSLEQDKLVLSKQGVKNKSDRRKWYTIDYEAWDKFCLMMGQKMSDQPSDKKCLMVGQKMSDDSSETSSNNSSEMNTNPVQGCIQKQAIDWDRAKNQLEVQLDRNSFDTWVRATEFIKYEDGIFYIGVPNLYARDMLQHRLYRDVRRVLSNIADQPAELIFEIHKALPVPEGELPLFKLLSQEN